MKGYELYGMVCGILSYGVVTGSVADNGTSPPRQLRIEQKGKRRGRNETLDGKNKAAALPSGFVSSIDPRNTHTNPPLLTFVSYVKYTTTYSTKRPSTFI